MATPVWTKIMDEIGARLASISITNGYFNDVRLLERARRNPFKDHDLPAMTYWKVSDRKDGDLYSNKQRELRVGIEFYSSSNDGDLDLLTDEFFSDLFISLFRDPLNPLVTDNPLPMFNDNFFNVNVESLQPIASEGSKPRLGVFAIISLAYQINNFDPFNLV